jgi:D-threonate/D-erythronate kinase
MNLTSLSKPWGIIADDLTGATDVASAFAVEGFTARVILDWSWIPSLKCDVVVLTTDSRCHPPVSAGRKVEEAVQLLASHSIELIYKKIDSTLKGNLVAEIDAISEVTKRPIVLCPANPTQGRTLIDGRIHVRGDTLNLVDILKQQGCRATIVVKQPIASFPMAPAKALDFAEEVLADASGYQEGATGCAYVIADAQSDSHLDAIVAIAARSGHHPLLVGSAGLAAAIARHLHRLHRGSSTLELDCSDRHVQALKSINSNRPTLLVIGSSNPVTLHQVKTLVASGQGIECGLSADQGSAILHGLTSGHSVAVKVPMEHRETTTIAIDMQAIVRLLEYGAAGSLLLSGGDTAQLFLDQLCSQAIDVLGEILPGLAVGKLIGGRADGLTLVTKPGGFGTDNSLSDAVALL